MNIFFLLEEGGVGWSKAKKRQLIPNAYFCQILAIWPSHCLLRKGQRKKNILVICVVYYLLPNPAITLTGAATGTRVDLVMTSHHGVFEQVIHYQGLCVVFIIAALVYI